MIMEFGRHFSLGDLIVIFCILSSIPQQKGSVLVGEKGTPLIESRGIGLNNSEVNLKASPNKTEELVDIADRGTYDVIPKKEDIKKCGLKVCNVTSNYPTSVVRNMLDERKLNPELFGTDLLASKLKTKNLCNSREFLIYPKLGQTAKNEWKYIVQDSTHDGSFVQGIRVEICLDKDGECEFMRDNADGYTAQCTQQFIYRQLITVSRNDTHTFYSQDSFKFPSGCVCQITED